MVWLIFLLCVSSVFVPTFQEESKCGYNSCHPTKDGYINVHIVAHTHDDVGWTKTVEEYYYDSKQPKYGGVKEILTSSFHSLLKNDTRRFIYVESAFLFKWWKEQDSQTKTLFKDLIDSGRLELVSGGWSMNDEATTHYQSIIDQFTLGLSKINETFGACGRPKAGWQIDPFGHSSEMASIFANLGFDGVFLGRIDFRDKELRFKTQTAEMLWQGSDTLGKESEIFTSVLYNTYWPPKGFCFDTTFCGSNEFEAHREAKWKDLVQFMEEEARVYKTNNIMLTMGGDFHYMDAESWFRNLDHVIEYGNIQQERGSKYHLMYSTPSCYLKAVQEEAEKTKLTWPTKTDDFLPYAHTAYAYWSGYYTSRPALKRYERMGNNFLQVCKQLQVLGSLGDSYNKEIDPLREAMGVLQHHDAVAGTEKQYVAEDYAKALSIGIDNCEIVTSDALNNLVPNQLEWEKTPDLPFTSCLLANVSQCEFSENSDSFVVTIYNPLSRPVNHYVRVPVTEENYSVRGPQDERPILQLIRIPEPVLLIPGRQSKATFELVFRALQVPPLGFKSYFIGKDKEDCNKNPDGHFDNEKVSVTISEDNGFLSKVSANGMDIPIRQEFLFYQTGTFSSPSGAYIFNPLQNKATPVAPKAQYVVHEGKVTTEIHQTFSDWLSQVIKVYHEEKFVELQWLVGPLPDDRGHQYAPEVISRFSTDLKTNSTFFTDSNGRGLLKRVRDFRPTWDFKPLDNAAENYYPVTSKILIRDDAADVEVAVLTDRSQGGSSLRDGEIELMVHRKSYRDDNLGVSEKLDEHAFGKPLVVRGSHYLFVGPYLNHSGESIAALEKDLAQRKLLEAWTFLSPAKELSYDNYQKLYKMEYSALNRALPKNVQILTLESLGDDRLLLRLEHVFEKNEDPVLSQPATVDLKDLFAAFRIVQLRETTLGGNQWLDESNPLQFDSDAKYFRRSYGPVSVNTKEVLENLDVVNRETMGMLHVNSNKFTIRLRPMQIRTFVVAVRNNNN